MKGVLRTKGGPGSGHFGHSGRPGKVGGSVPGKGVHISNRHAIGKAASLDCIQTKGKDLIDYEYATVVAGRKLYSELVDEFYGNPKGYLYESVLEQAQDRYDKLSGTESYEESLAMVLRQQVQKETDWGTAAVGDLPYVHDVVVNNLVDELGISKEDALMYVRSWNISAWEGKAINFQHIAWELSGREDLPYEPMYELMSYANPTSVDRQVFNEIYNETQTLFRNAGINTVTLYRGVQLPVQIYDDMYKAKQGVVPFRQGPLSSWSFDPYIGTCFGNCIMAVEVPVERVWSVGLAGPGTYGEFEAILFEGIGDDEVSYKWTR